MSVGNPSLTTEALGETTWFGTQGLCRTETVRAARLEMELIRPQRGGLKELHAGDHLLNNGQLKKCFNEGAAWPPGPTKLANNQGDMWWLKDALVTRYTFRFVKPEEGMATAQQALAKAGGPTRAFRLRPGAQNGEYLVRPGAAAAAELACKTFPPKVSGDLAAPDARHFVRPGSPSCASPRAGGLAQLSLRLSVHRRSPIPSTPALLGAGGSLGPMPGSLLEKMFTAVGASAQATVAPSSARGCCVPLSRSLSQFPSHSIS